MPFDGAMFKVERRPPVRRRTAVQRVRHPWANGIALFVHQW